MVHLIKLNICKFRRNRFTTTAGLIKHLMYFFPGEEKKWSSLNSYYRSSRYIWLEPLNDRESLHSLRESITFSDLFLGEIPSYSLYKDSSTTYAFPG